MPTVARVEGIAPAVAEAKKEKGDLIAKPVRANVKLVIKQSKPILVEQVEKRKTKIVDAVYQLNSGEVLLLPEDTVRLPGAGRSPGQSVLATPEGRMNDSELDQKEAQYAK